MDAVITEGAVTRSRGCIAAAEAKQKSRKQAAKAAAEAKEKTQLTMKQQKR